MKDFAPFLARRKGLYEWNGNFRPWANRTTCGSRASGVPTSKIISARMLRVARYAETSI
jgi:hypothetical protein